MDHHDRHPRPPGATVSRHAEEPREIGGDDQEQALTRARVKIDEIEAEAQSDR
jgi:hypothetical protein